MDPQIANDRLCRSSLERLTGSSPQFLNHFYQNFICGSDDIATMFRGRSAERIKHKLTTTLELVTDSINNVPGTDMYLELLGRIHDRRHVTLEHFLIWKAALMKAIAECDPEFNDALGLAWEQVLNSVLNKIRDDTDLADLTVNNPQPRVISIHNVGNESALVPHF